MSSNLDEFIKKSKLKGGGGNDTFDYSLSVYTSNEDNITLICNKHKKEFSQKVSNHLTGEVGCPECKGTTYDTESFIRKATLKHNGKYIYKNSRWINSKTPITITCPIHGDFNQNPNNHLSGEGCPRCGCQKSILEDELKDAIKKEGFNIESRVSVKWLGKQSLDILIKIDSLLIAIECQGIGHYDYTAYTSTKSIINRIKEIINEKKQG